MGDHSSSIREKSPKIEEKIIKHKKQEVEIEFELPPVPVAKKKYECKVF